MSVTLNERGVDVALRESRLAPRRRLRFNAVVSGQSEDGGLFEEKATVRDLSLQGAYLVLEHKPKLQSELRVVIEAAGEQNRSSLLSLRATVIHCKDRTREQPERHRRAFYRRSRSGGSERLIPAPSPLVSHIIRPSVMSFRAK